MTYHLFALSSTKEANLYLYNFLSFETFPLLVQKYSIESTYSTRVIFNHSKDSNTRSDKKGKIDKIFDGSSGSHGTALDGYPSKIPFLIRPCI
jgi:hypothetical protein